MRRIFIVLVLFAAAMVAAYAFATGAFFSPRPQAWLTDRPIAHRGQWSDGAQAPENSLPAFEAAASNGYAIELDVHHSKDGKIVVIHDDGLESMAGTDALVSELTLEQIKALRLKDGDETVPTLEETLELVAGRVPIFVEIKNDGEVGALEDDVAATLESYDGEVAVMSFNPFSVARVADSAPGLPIGQLSGSFEGEDLSWYEVFLLRSFMMNWKSRPDFVAYELKLLPSLSTNVQRWRGRPLLGWTAENSSEWESTRPLVDGLIADPGALPKP